MKVILALAAAGLVLCGGAYAGGAFEAPRVRAAAAYDRPAGAEIAVGDALVVSGQPMQLSIFYTADAPERVIAFYTAAFLERGLLPVTAQGHVAVFEPKDGLERFVSALAQPAGQTLVLLGITNPRKAPKLLNGASSAGFPVPAESRAFLGYRSEDAGARAESGQFVTRQSAGEIAGWYREELSKQGFREGQSTPGLLSFARPGATISIGVQALEEKAGAAVFVNRLEGEAGK